jgi:hypothetical protein
MREHVVTTSILFAVEPQIITASGFSVSPKNFNHIVWVLVRIRVKMCPRNIFVCADHVPGDWRSRSSLVHLLRCVETNSRFSCACFKTPMPNFSGIAPKLMSQDDQTHPAGMLLKCISRQASDTSQGLYIISQLLRWLMKPAWYRWQKWNRTFFWGPESHTGYISRNRISSWTPSLVMTVD